MNRIEGAWESSISLLNLQGLVHGITYAEGRLISNSSDIMETPFSISTNRHRRAFKLSGKIIFKYIQCAPPTPLQTYKTMPVRMLEDLITLTLPDYQRAQQNFYSLFEQGCGVDDIEFQYDRLILSLRDEGDKGVDDLRELQDARENYLNLLRDIERERELNRT
jgi:hypothetical protein